jgi:hypothetical protein
LQALLTRTTVQSPFLVSNLAIPQVRCWLLSTQATILISHESLEEIIWTSDRTRFRDRQSCGGRCPICLPSVRAYSAGVCCHSTTSLVACRCKHGSDVHADCTGTWKYMSQKWQFKRHPLGQHAIADSARSRSLELRRELMCDPYVSYCRREKRPPEPPVLRIALFEDFCCGGCFGTIAERVEC